MGEQQKFFMIVLCVYILWSSFALIFVSESCGNPECRCTKGILCLCEAGKCDCQYMCNHKLATIAYMNGVESFGNTQKHIGFKERHFEMTSLDSENGSPKNLLFGEGEFIFGKGVVHIFVMADLYVIGANLYAAKNQDVEALHYNVYIGDSDKVLKFKLGELKRSLDGRYKLEFKSQSEEIIQQLINNSYICIKIEDDGETLRQTLLEGFY